MIPFKSFCFKNYQCEKCKNNQRDDFLHNLKLHERKGASVTAVSNSVSRHLKTILKKSYAPADRNDGNDAQLLKPFHFVKLQVSIPCKRHEYVGHYE